MTPERLFTRIKLNHIEGAELGYYYTRKSLTELTFKKDTYEGAEFLEIGNEIIYENKKYVIKNITFKLETELWKMTEEGVNLQSSDTPTDFNVTINVFIDNL